MLFRSEDLRAGSRRVLTLIVRANARRDKSGVLLELREEVEQLKVLLRLAYDAKEGKVIFEFEPRTSKYPPRKTAAGTAVAPAAKKAAGKTTAKTAAKKTPAKKAAAKKEKAPRAGNLTPSAALQAVIGQGLVSRPEVTKKLWDYIKAQGLQDPKEIGRAHV